MQVRKSKALDGTDRDILRILYLKSPLVTRQIAKNVGLTGSAVVPRLNNLKELGIIKQHKLEKIRNFERSFGNKTLKINSPRSIYWGLDIKK
jgi:DNA-binding Lrp family transcriptional regulator